MTKDEALKMAIEVMDNIEIPFRQYADEAINACIEALEPEPMTTTDVITCKMVGKCCMTGEALEQPLTRDWKHTIDERIARDSEFKEALERPSNMVAVPLDKLQDMQRRLSDCEEYLKEDETPAECIARNRKDANTTLKLLAKCMGEKKALEQPAQGIELEWYVKGWDDALKDKNSI
jgi:hypothetical protein